MRPTDLFVEYILFLKNASCSTSADCTAAAYNEWWSIHTEFADSQQCSFFSLCNNQVSFACDDSERYGLKVHSTKVITWLKRPKPHLKVGTHFRSKMNILYHIGRWTTFAVEITIIWSEISHFQSKVLLDLQIFLFYVIALIFLYSGRTFFNGLLLTWILLWILSFLTFFLQRH